MLYVGHRGDTHPWWRTSFASRLGSPSLSVIDILPGNLSTTDSIPEVTGRLLGDLRVPESAPPGFGLVFWDEGPEHVSRPDALTCLEMLMDRHGWVLVSCPWGYQPQGSGPEDVEFHHWGPEVSDFESIGMEGRAFGDRFDGQGHGHGNVIAWGRRNP